MFRNVYGHKNKRWPAADGIVEFIEENNIAAIHELTSKTENKFLVDQFAHRNNPTLYFCLPDGTQPVEPAVDRVRGEIILEKLEQLMDAFRK